MSDTIPAGVRDFWMNAALGLKDELVQRGNRIEELERELAQQETDMRTAAKVDANQAAIVQAFRQLGARVQVLSHVGKGFPDLLICVRGKLALIEIKDGDKSASRRKLTPDEQAWHAEWQDAPLFIVASVEEAAVLINEWGML